MEDQRKVIMVGSTSLQDLPHGLADTLNRDPRFNQHKVLFYNDFPEMYKELDDMLLAGKTPAAIITNDTRMLDVAKEKSEELDNIPVYFLASRDYPGPTPHPQSTATFFRDGGEEILVDVLCRKLKSQTQRLGGQSPPGSRKERG